MHDYYFVDIWIPTILLRCRGLNACDKVFCAFGGHLGSHMQYCSMKHKRNHLASFDLHIIVCLCYKMIYGRDTINRKSHLSHTRTCWFFVSLPHPLLRYLKTQINIKGGVQTSSSFVQISISIPEPILKQTGIFGWLFRKKNHPGLLFFFKNDNIFSFLWLLSQKYGAQIN